MRIALIADIHGNAVALDAVLAHLAIEPPDRIICLGDVALRGPEPRRALRRVRELNCPVVLGNGDAWLLDWQAGCGAGAPFPWMQENDEWCAGQLSAEDFAFMATFAQTIEIPLEGNRQLLCFHGSPRSHSEEISTTTPSEMLARMFQGCTATFLAGGHTHIPLLRQYGTQTIINPGSVGQPITRLAPDGPIRLLTQAQYAILRIEGDMVGVEFRQVSLNLTEVIEAGYRTGMPAARRWARQWQTGLFFPPE